MELDIFKVQMLMSEQLLNAKELSRKSNLSEYGIHNILKGKTKAGLVSIGKISKGLNVPVSELIIQE